jgi:Ca2+-binding EF-hand superfamily protein
MNINKLNYNFGFPVPPPRPTAQNITDNLFSTLDSTNKGYFEKNDLKSLFESTTAGDSSQITNDLFSNFDSNSDGKVTRAEMNTILEQFTSSIDSYAKVNIQRQADMLPFSQAYRSFDYSQGDNSASVAENTDGAIHVSDIDTNNDGLITSNEIDTYFNNARYAVAMQNNLSNWGNDVPDYVPTEQENQMLDLVTTLQNYTSPVNDVPAKNVA